MRDPSFFLLTFVLALALCGGSSCGQNPSRGDAPDPGTIPILVFHRITAPGTPVRSPYDLPVDRFDQHLQYLRNNGYTPVSMDIFLHPVDPDRIPRKPVILTFDDGFQSAVTRGVPLLKKYGMTAVFFVCTGLLDTGPYMRWKEVRRLSEDGFTIGSHSSRHDHLDRRRRHESADDYAARVLADLSRSKKVLEERLERPILHLAYPYGGFHRALEQLSMKAGYRTISLATSGPNLPGAPPHRLKRSIIRSTTTLRGLADILEQRPLPASQFNPEEGSVIGVEEKFMLKAALSDVPSWDPACFRFWLDDRPVEAAWDPVSGEISCTLPVAPRPGFHTAAIHARKKGAGPPYTASWSFRTGTKRTENEYRDLEVLLGTAGAVNKKGRP